MLGLGHDSDSPQCVVKVAHKSVDPAVDRTEVMIIHLLTLERRRAEKRSSGIYEILALLIYRFVDKKIFLFSSDCRDNPRRGRIAEKAENTQRLIGQRVDGAQKRCLLVESLAGI